MATAVESLGLFGSQQPQNCFEFPQSLTEKYRPRVIADFAGLEKPKKIAEKLIANPRESAWLFMGPSGVGKTTFALAIAEAIPAELHHIPSQECNLDNIERVRRTCQYVPQSGKRAHLVLIDEADQMTPAAQISMLSKLDSTNFPPNTIFILTCNSTDRLESRFLSRLHTVEFSSYGISAEASLLLRKIWDEETNGSVDRPDFSRIVKDSRNNVRAAMMALETEIMSA